jgi:myo-inositol-1(or 4)-monophosphatase
MNDTLLDCLTAAGRLLLERFGKVRDIRLKETRSSIVTEADLASEALIFSRIRARHPDHNLVGEESGFQDRGAAFTWVVDPLDGTSNFAAGIPWFGVMIAVLERDEPVLAGMYLPVDDLLYFAARGTGATRNGQPIRVTAETSIANILCGYGMDANASDERARRQAAALGALVQKVRNVRATNSLVDFAYTIDGRLGACVNYNMMLWDIAAPRLILAEAGALATDLSGQPFRLSLGPDCCARSYGVLAASPALHPQVLHVLQTAPA